MFLSLGEVTSIFTPASLLPSLKDVVSSNRRFGIGVFLVQLLNGLGTGVVSCREMMVNLRLISFELFLFLFSN